MLFNSLEFVVWFPIIAGIYFLLPHRFRWILLLLASYYFYMCWKAEYVVLIFISTIIDYFAGIRIANAKSKLARKLYLSLSVCTNLGLLFAFKYFNFFADSTRLLLSNISVMNNIPHFNLLLPVGISFYTFQTLGYSIDVYRGRIKPQKHFGIFALYVSFFPQLVAGPIERASHLMPQFFEKQKFCSERILAGVTLCAKGFFKKIVIADNVALLVDLVYNDPQNFSGWPLITATILFAIQIYCDFSGYSDIAIGIARILGFRLMTNFNKPYLARSIAEFWKRWHISLSTWFRDYLYIPLGGNRVTLKRFYLNIFITFVISGLWHGANWTFIVWGFLHALYMLMASAFSSTKERMLLFFRIDRKSRIVGYFNVVVTFSLVCFAWIFFRANSLRDSAYIVSHLFHGLGNFSSLEVLFSSVSRTQIYVFVIIAFFGLNEAFYLFEEDGFQKSAYVKNKYFRAIKYAICFIAILTLGKISPQNFIYFQF